MSAPIDSPIWGPAAVSSEMRAVLFDLDGVLVESWDVWFHVMRGVARKFGYPEISAEQMRSSWGQSVVDDVRNFYPRMSIEQLEHEYHLLFAENVHHLKVDPESVPTLTGLNARGIKVAVVTNSPADVARTILEEAGIVPDGLVCAGDVAAPKPAPDGILKALSILAIATSQAVFVGDTIYDREAARRAGVHFVGYRIDGDTRIECLSSILELAPVA
jgi:HAD superfamily hydrolase (TIGR01509 family)